MAEVNILNDTFSDNGNTSGSKKSTKITKLFKNKPFLIGVGVVTVLGLLSWSKKSNQSSAIAIEDGYSTLNATGSGAGGGYDYEYVDKQIEALENQNYSDLTEILNAFESTTNALESEIEALEREIDTSKNTVSLGYSQNDIAFKNDIETMKTNSDRYYFATSQAEKDYLHNQNMEIANKWGLSFNSNDGYYYDNSGNRVYSTTVQTENVINNINAKSYSTPNNPDYSNAISQMLANSEAWHNTTDNAERERLHNENQKIASEYGLSFNSQSGTWHTSDGSTAYTLSNTNKSSSSSSSSKSSSSSSSSSSSGSTKKYQSDKVKVVNIKKAVVE